MRDAGLSDTSRFFQRFWGVAKGRYINFLNNNNDDDDHLEQKPRVHVCEQEAKTASADDVESNGSVSSHMSTMRRLMRLAMSQVFAQSCVLTFLAEWGDRSQISTIILAARDVSPLVLFSVFL